MLPSANGNSAGPDEECGGLYYNPYLLIHLEQEG